VLAEKHIRSSTTAALKSGLGPSGGDNDNIWPGLDGGVAIVTNQEHVGLDESSSTAG
jgi:hypothetical protein